MKWIKDRNPEENQWCLVAVRDKDGKVFTIVTLLLWLNKNFYHRQSGTYAIVAYNFYDAVIIGWMPLPEPPH